MATTDDVTSTTQAQNSRPCPNIKEDSPVKVKTPTEAQEEATDLLLYGKEHILDSDFPSAVACFGRACELFSAQFGEYAKECAESYFYCGKALLELSRLEVEDQENESTEDGGMEEGDDSEADESTTEGGENAEEKKEEESYKLQLACGMLELAKSVYTKQMESSEGTEAELEKLCSTMLSLGEVSLEKENYSKAVEELQLCLKTQESLPKENRIVAETHYQLGVALGFNSQFEKAMESLITAIKIIEERIKNIKEGVKKGLIRRKDVIKEFNELEALIPEIYEKIADTKSMQEAVSKTKQGSEGLTSSVADLAHCTDRRCIH